MYLGAGIISTSNSLIANTQTPSNSHPTSYLWHYKISWTHAIPARDNHQRARDTTKQQNLDPVIHHGRNL